MAYNFKQGLYTPKHPEKYCGDVNRIVYRSSWELSFNQFLDNNANVLRWASEEIIIPYVKPTDGKIHKYYVDYLVEYRNTSGEVQVDLIEVKPQKQTRRSRSKIQKTKLVEDITYAINQAKWKAASDFAEQRGWKFRIITEKTLFR